MARNYYMCQSGTSNLIRKKSSTTIEIRHANRRGVSINDVEVSLFKSLRASRNRHPNAPINLIYDKIIVVNLGTLFGIYEKIAYLTIEPSRVQNFGKSWDDKNLSQLQVQSWDENNLSQQNISNMQFRMRLAMELPNFYTKKEISYMFLSTVSIGLNCFFSNNWSITYGAITFMLFFYFVKNF